MADVKFCGLTRPEDAEQAAVLGARFAGVIFAGGPRALSPERARVVLAPLAGGPVRRVGVFGAQTPEEIAGIAHASGLDVVQLHGGATAHSIAQLRGRFAGEIWAVVRVSGDAIPGDAESLGTEADGVVFDAAVPGQLGGTGVTLAWEGVGPAVARFRQRWLAERLVVLAGGLRPSNVARASALVRPDVVDVSSGVESAPGVKDHELMRAFADAARSRREE